MNRTVHKIYITILSLITLYTLIYLSYRGFNYYNTAIEERFYQTEHNNLKPSGSWGHGLGIIGSLAMIIGVSAYMARKRFKSMFRLGLLKHWLEFHIFLCTLGPIMVLFHTAYKFGGIVAISFWSMVAVFISGVIGRFIYLQIPRSIEGQELSLSEIRDLKNDIGNILQKDYQLDDESFQQIAGTIQNIEKQENSKVSFNFIKKYFENKVFLGKVRSILNKSKLSKAEKKKVLRLVKDELALNRKIERLQTMQNLFKYWHVAHLPFALIMLVIMVIHVIVTIVFGYRWIF